MAEAIEPQKPTAVHEFDVEIYELIMKYSGKLTHAEMIGVLSVRLGDIQVRRIVNQHLETLDTNLKN